MKFTRVSSLFILLVGSSGVNFLRILDFLVGLDFASEISQTALRGRQGTSRSNETTSPLENNSHALEVKKIPLDHENETDFLCSREEIKAGSGSWIPVTIKQPPYITKTSHLRCYPMSDYTNGHWKTHEWKPASNCELTRWKRENFCSLMKRSTVMIIGDSLSWEHFSSLGQLLGLRIFQTTQHESKLRQSNFVQLACKNQVRIVFRRDDKLSNLTDAIDSTFPQVLVMNRGAHYVNDTTLTSGIHRTIEEIKVWKSRCRQMGIKCHLFWRTSVPGHPLCDQVNFTEPVNNLEEMEAWIANRSNYNNRTIKYHWYDYQHQNELVLDTLYRSLGDDFDVLDAYHLNLLRPDEHRAHQGDCLHNCYPGKMDLYSQLMLHFLKMRRTRGDVDTLIDLFDRQKNNRQSVP
jgi:hypothetical protein